MTTFYTVVNWLVILGYWLLIAGVTLRILMKRRAVPSAMAWLLIIYILPLVGIIAYLSFGELHLGKRRAERARAMWPSTAKWLNDLKACKHIFAEDNSPVAESLFKLCERRQGIGGVKGNQLQLLTESDDVMQALIRDIQLARHNIEMVFYIWQPGGMADSVAESLMAAARRGVHCRLMLDSAGSVAFFRSPWAAMMRNAGIEVVEALKVNLMRVFLRRMDLRQHRKMVMIDNYIAYTGSMNMVDPRYFKQDSGVGQWIDLMAPRWRPRWASSTPVTGRSRPESVFCRRRRTSISCRLKRPVDIPSTRSPPARGFRKILSIRRCSPPPTRRKSI